MKSNKPKENVSRRAPFKKRYSYVPEGKRISSLIRSEIMIATTALPDFLRLKSTLVNLRQMWLYLFDRQREHHRCCNNIKDSRSSKNFSNQCAATIGKGRQ